MGWARLLRWLWPTALSALCPLLAMALPEVSVAGQAAAALLWSAPPVLALVQVGWSVGCALRWRAAWPALGLLAAVGAGLPVGWGAAVAPAPGGLRVAVFNVNAFSPEAPEPLLAAIDALQLDILVMVEQRVLGVPGMTLVADNFDEPLPRPSYGSGVWCRGACAAELSPLVGAADQQMPLAVVRLPGRAVCLLGLHTPPPAPLRATGIGPHTRWIAGFIEQGRLARSLGPCRAGDGVIAAGDLNHVPGSAPYRRLRARGLRDALSGRGLWATSWPSGGGFPALPLLRLDHVLVGAADVGPPERVALPGSDHRGFVFTVAR